MPALPEGLSGEGRDNVRAGITRRYPLSDIVRQDGGSEERPSAEPYP